MNRFIIAAGSALLLAAAVTVALRTTSDAPPATLKRDGGDTQAESRPTGEGLPEKAPPAALGAAGETLDLSGQGLTTVPHSVFERREVEILNLSNNTLTGALPAEVR